MSDKGKYDALNLEELQALRAALNAEEEPERAAEIDAAIARKQAEVIAAPDAETITEPSDTTITRSVSHEATPASTASESANAAFKTEQEPALSAQPDDRLASLGERLGGAIIDMVISVLISIPLGFFVGMEALAQPTFSLLLMSMVYSVVTYIVVHGYFLINFGQTVGKHFINTRIENLDGSQSSFTNIVVRRYLLVAVIVNIPFIGGIAALVDIFFVFRKDRRCVHDFIAGTRVCRVPESIDA